MTLPSLSTIPPPSTSQTETWPALRAWAAKPTMRLMIGRHGYAGGYSPIPEVERNRELTILGRKSVEAVAAKIVSMGEAPKLILSSPFARALQTADIYGQALGCNVDTCDELQPHRDLYDWFWREILNDGSVKRYMI